jgi:hypothetical protein
VCICFSLHTFRIFLHGTSQLDVGDVTISNGCNSSIVSDIGAEDEKTPTISGEKVMLCHQRLGHIREKGFRLLHNKGMVEGISNSSLDFDFCEHCI